jgi:hypothetical protein
LSTRRRELRLPLTHPGEVKVVLDSLEKPLKRHVRCYQTQVDSSPDKVREKVRDFEAQKLQILHNKTTMPAAYPSSGAPRPAARNKQQDGHAFAGRRVPKLVGTLRWSDPSTAAAVEGTYRSRHSGVRCKLMKLAIWQELD